MAITLDELAAMLAESAREARPRLEADLAKIGEITKIAARELIGHEHPEWPPLAPATIEDKEHKGFGVPDPLLRTGEMRDSIEMEIEPAELEVAIGSTMKIAAYQEIGTTKIPPRPFLGLAAEHALAEFDGLLIETAVKLLTPKV